LSEASVSAAHVLIVSKDGCNRAGTIAAGFVLRKLKLSVSQAVSYVRQARPCFQPTEQMEDNLYTLIESPDQDDVEDDEVDYHEDEAHAERRVSARTTDAMRDEKRAAFMTACSMVHDAFWFYGDLETLEGGDVVYTDSALDCCAKCDEHPLCYKWSYGLAGKERKRCYLKREKDGYQGDRAHFLSGKSTVRKRALVKSSDAGEL